MSPDVITSFLTYYVRSLAERSRLEKTANKLGFDWVIYNLALANNLTPYRLPFVRGGPNETSKTKTEPELGVDSSFLSADRKTLYIFVLKDEVLCNATWIANGFENDLRMAAAPDLSPPEFKEVSEVKIILAYNKDEDQTGIRLFDNLTRALGATIANTVSLTFERWNLTTLVEKVSANLLTPSLLPQKFFSLFSYICSQFSDFHHGSDEWTHQLVPNWKRFLNDLLVEKADERSVRLIPVALIILREHGASNPSAETGWIDLAEWAMLSVWQVFQSTEKKVVREAVFQMWLNFYLIELERYYQSHSEELAVEHSLAYQGSGRQLDAIAAAVVAHWHIARLGILAFGSREMANSLNEDDKRQLNNLLQKIANWLISLLNSNPAALRPLIDLNHIEIFLIWRTLWQVGRMNDINLWLLGLRSRLFTRRAGIDPLPFLEGRNSLDLVLEHVATGKKPPEFCDQSSLLLLCLLEFSFCLDSKDRDTLLALIYRELVLGQDPYGNQFANSKPIDLMGWIPPEDWAKKILSESLADEGESQTMEMFNSPSGMDGSAIASHIEEFVRQSRIGREFHFPDNLPASLITLACLKNRSPLPPELWRLSIFKRDNTESK